MYAVHTVCDAPVPGRTAVPHAGLVGVMVWCTVVCVVWCVACGRGWEIVVIPPPKKLR